MFKHDPQFVGSLVEYCTDKLEQINEYDSFSDDFATLCNQHQKLTDKLAPLVESDRQAQEKEGKDDSQAPKKVLDANGIELTGAALDANIIINDILNKYKKKTAAKQSSLKPKSSKNSAQGAKTNHAPKVSNAQSIYADFYQFVRSFTNTESEELFNELLSPESIEHDVLVENLTVMSQVPSIALNRHIVHVNEGTSKYCDLNCLLNTCDVLDNLPTWSLVLDLSQCKECAPIEGLAISRLTYLKDGKMNAPFTSTHNDEDIFLEELGLSLNIHGQWFTLSLAATLDNDRTISDLVRELGYFAADQLEQVEVPALSEREQLDEPDWDEAEQIIDPKFNDDDFAKALYHAFKYVTYTITHTELITDAQGKAVTLKNDYSFKLPKKPEDLIATLSERLSSKEDPFTHFFI